MVQVVCLSGAVVNIWLFGLKLTTCTVFTAGVCVCVCKLTLIKLLVQCQMVLSVLRGCPHPYSEDVHIRWSNGESNTMRFIT